jgi:ABC-type glucose/galactose transport system permease subunit
MGDPFEEKYREMERVVDEVIRQNNPNVKSCVPKLTIFAIAAPVLVFLLLYFFQPSIVKVKDGIKMVRSTKRVFLYTLGITLVIWALMYAYSYMKGHSLGSMFCSVKA